MIVRRYRKQILGVACVFAIGWVIPAVAAADEKAPESTQPDAKKTQPAVPAAPKPAETATTVTSAESGTEETAADGEIAENAPEQGAVPLKDLTLGEAVEESDKRHPFIADARVKLQLRSYYMYRDKYDDALSEAEALGAALSFKSGYLWKRLAIGGAVYTSVPLYAQEDRDGTGLLRAGQEGYIALGQIYGEVKIIDGLQLNFGRKEYNTPYINLHDVRMTPKTFQGITLTGTRPGSSEGSMWRYGGGYIYKMKDWTDTEFHWTSNAVGVPHERGIATVGANYSTKKWSAGLIDYYSPDIMNIFFTEGSYGWKTSPNTSIRLTGQLSDQRSVGNDLITGDSFDVAQWGVKADVGLWSGTITVGFTDVSNGGTDMRSPWGGYPGYTSVQVKDFNRSGESAILLKAGYDFTKLGAAGLSAYALWVHGFDRDGGGSFNEDEWDLNVQWAPKEGPLKDFSARLRYAYILQNGGGDPEFTDFRFILNYNFSLYPFGN